MNEDIIENKDVAGSGWPKKHKMRAVIVAISFAMVVAIAAALWYASSFGTNRSPEEKLVKIEKFKSEEEFRQYLSASKSLDSLSFGLEQTGRGATMELSPGMADKTSAPTRFSDTNVQVAGIDEPDIVKTDGRHIFFSHEPSYFSYRFPVEVPSPEPDRFILPPDNLPSPGADIERSNIKIIAPVPPEQISVEAQTPATNGSQLLLKDDTLVALDNNSLTAFDVSSRSTPTEKWKINFDDNVYIVESRLIDETIYVLAQKYTSSDMPCPIPFAGAKAGLTIACTDIYRPSIPVPFNVVYLVSKVDIHTGNTTGSISFIGDSYASAVYVSSNHIYTTFTRQPDYLSFMLEFLRENSDLVSNETMAKINNLPNLDISSEAKLYELDVLIREYLASLPEDQRRRLNETTQNRMTAFLKQNARRMQSTSILKIALTDLAVANSGSVPGVPLNQFSLDEYDGMLRIATTISVGSMFGRGEPENDLYVLGQNLEIIGRVQGLAPGERIFSARFIGQTAYLVTFEEIDPFFVIDLADPNNPKVAGELKIPGFSTYLHPLTSNHILGIGRENRFTKLSLFDVSNPSGPIEANKFILSEFWSEAEHNHRAFLHDTENNVFFLPAGNSAYVFAYGQGNMELVRVVTGISAKRAVFIDNFFYIIGSEKVVVLDMNGWREVSSLEF